MLGALEVDVDVEVFLQFLLDVWKLLNQGKLVDRLRIVGDRAVRIDGDGDRAHTEETKGNKAKRKHRRSDHQIADSEVADEVADGHQNDHHEAKVIAGEIAGNESGEDAERCAALLR